MHWTLADKLGVGAAAAGIMPAVVEPAIFSQQDLWSGERKSPNNPEEWINNPFYGGAPIGMGLIAGIPAGVLAGGRGMRAGLVAGLGAGAAAAYATKPGAMRILKEDHPQENVGITQNIPMQEVQELNDLLGSNGAY